MSFIILHNIHYTNILIYQTEKIKANGCATIPVFALNTSVLREHSISFLNHFYLKT